MELAQLIHHRRHQLRAPVAKQLDADPQAALAVAVGKTPVAERGHDRQHLDARLGERVRRPLPPAGVIAGEQPSGHELLATPVFVLTHHPRPSIEMEGGTAFHFVDATPQEALDLAREAAGDLDVRVGGGPSTVRDFLAADLIDTLHVVQVPILLGRGVRLWDGLEAIEERYDVETVSSPSGVTHLTFTRR